MKPHQKVYLLKSSDNTYLAATPKGPSWDKQINRAVRFPDVAAASKLAQNYPDSQIVIGMQTVTVTEIASWEQPLKLTDIRPVELPPLHTSTGSNPVIREVVNVV